MPAFATSVYARMIHDGSSWRTEIVGNSLLSHDPADWLLYGLELLESLTPGLDATRHGISQC